MEKRLTELDLRENTIVIFMTDNGSSGGARLNKNSFLTAGYNAGMRGRKGSYYDGGHRGPFFLRWPKKLTIPMESNVSDEFAARAVYPGQGTPATFRPVSARVRIYDQEKIVAVPNGAEEISFIFTLNPDEKTTLDAWFTDDKGKEHGAYYVYVILLEQSRT